MKSEYLDKPPLFAKITVTLVVSFILFAVVWAANANVDELARGEGKVIPLSKTQIIQSSESGVVQEIAVSLGQTVKKGQLIIQLDDTTTNASLAESQARARSYEATIIRLETEIEDILSGKFNCPEHLLLTASRTCENEALLFEKRRDGFKTKHSVLSARKKQREFELKEAMVNVQRIIKVLEQMNKEREKIAPLVKRKLHPEISLIQLEREIEEHIGQKALAEQSMQRLDSAIDEATYQLDEIAIQYKQEAYTELSTVLAELEVLQATIVGASDRVKRTDINSPVDGIVNTLEVNTLGAFVQPGAVVAGIVPTTDTLLIEARISPRDVAFIRPGQETIIKITAYDFSIFGGLKGEVSNVSADSIVDQETGDTYYNVRVKTGDSKLVKSGKEHDIRPGMVASVEIKTGKKTVLDYLLKPLIKARNEALTER